MKLPIDQEQSQPPNSLTDNFFLNLMNQQAKKTGVLQILQFKKKRQRVYSTRISDGYFKVKVMVTNQAAEQIDQGLIEPMFILKGPVRNHGKGVIILKQKVQIWRYNNIIGDIVPWKINRQNINKNGTNLINWANKQQIVAINSKSVKQEKTNLQQQNEVKQDILKQKQKLNQIKLMARKLLLSSPQGSQQIIQIQQEEQPRDIAIKKQLILKQSDKQLEQTLEKPISDDCDSEEFAIVELILNKKHLGKVMQMSQADIEDRQNFKRIVGEKSIQRKNKINNILSLLLSQSEESFSKEQHSQNLQPRASGNLETNTGRTITLQSILDFLNLEDQNENITQAVDKKQRQPDRLEDKNKNQQDDDEFIDWYISKKYQQTKEQNQEKKLAQYFPGDKYIDIADIYYGCIDLCLKDWWSSLLLKVFQEQENNIIKAVISDQHSKFLFDSIFRNIDQLKQQLNEGCFYKIQNGTIKAVFSDHNKFKGSAFELEFDCSKINIEKVKQLENNGVQNIFVDQQLLQFENENNYVSALKMQELNEVLINVYGIILSCKLIKTKENKFMQTYQIVHFQSKYIFTFTMFNISPQNYKLALTQKYQNRPITVFNAKINLYKGKNNLVNSNNTIIKLDWLPRVQSRQKLVKWLTEENQIKDMEINLFGYKKISSLAQLQFQLAESECYIQNVQIIEFKKNYKYEGCSNCLKKIENFRCRQCGMRNLNQIVQRIFIRGQIGDNSSVVSVIWPQPLCLELIKNGFLEMRKRWLLKVIHVWIKKGSNQTLNIHKMKFADIKTNIAMLLSNLKQSTLC